MISKLRQAALLIFRNLFSLLLALILAIAIWVVAEGEEDPFEERAYPNPIDIQIIGQPEDMLIVNQPLTEASITLRAPASVWDTLINSQIHITADLSDLEVGEHSVPLAGSVSDHTDVQVIDTEPGAIAVVLEQLATRELPVTLRIVGEPAIGYDARPARLSADTVFVSGPASLVDSVSEIVTSISITNMRDSLTQDISLRAVNAEGRTITGISISPATVQATIDIRQLGGYRDVAVRASIEGQVAPGYRVTNIITTPTIVTVFSETPQLVDDLPGFVETEPLDITDARDDVDAHLTLVLPEGVSQVGEQSVQVQVGVAALLSSLILEPDIDVTGLPPDLIAILSPETIVVILSGPVPALDALAIEDVSVIVDVLGLSPGTYEIEPQVVIVDANVTVDTILPAIVEVTVTIPDQ